MLGICLGCAEEDEGEVVARIGNEVVTFQDLEARLEGMPPFMMEQLNTPDGRKRLLTAIVEEEIIVREARTRKLQDTEEFKTEIERRERDMLVRLFYEMVIEAASKPSDAQVAEYYEANKAEFTIPETIEARHILVETEREAEAVRKDLEAGSDFAETAGNKSLDIFSKDRGGVLQGGVKRDGDIPGLGKIPELIEACFQLDEGELSQPIKTERGYHIVRVDKRIPEAFKPLDEVREDIISRMTYENRNAMRDSILTDLKEKYDVVFLEDVTPKEQTPEELFKIASEEPNPTKKIMHYKQFLGKFPDDERAYEAKFMIGFTMAEDIKDYDGAEEVFKEFLEEFPETDLSDDATWMIENMRSGEEPEFGSD
jgi:peptidyl-prolyl cis-trans isomerase C